MEPGASLAPRAGGGPARAAGGPAVPCRRCLHSAGGREAPSRSRSPLSAWCMRKKSFQSICADSVPKGISDMKSQMPSLRWGEHGERAGGDGRWGRHPSTLTKTLAHHRNDPTPTPINTQEMLWKMLRELYLILGATHRKDRGREIWGVKTKHKLHINTTKQYLVRKINSGSEQRLCTRLWTRPRVASSRVRATV